MVRVYRDRDYGYCIFALSALRLECLAGSVFFEKEGDQMNENEDKEKAMKEGIMAVGTITAVVLNELNKEIDKVENKEAAEIQKGLMGMVGALSIGLGTKMVYEQVYKEEIQKSREEKEKAENEEKDRIEKRRYCLRCAKCGSEKVCLNYNITKGKGKTWHDIEFGKYYCHDGFGWELDDFNITCAECGSDEIKVEHDETKEDIKEVVKRLKNVKPKEVLK